MLIQLSSRCCEALQSCGDHLHAIALNGNEKQGILTLPSVRLLTATNSPHRSCIEQLLPSPWPGHLHETWKGHLDPTTAHGNPGSLGFHLVAPGPEAALGSRCSCQLGGQAYLQEDQRETQLGCHQPPDPGGPHCWVLQSACEALVI